MISFHDCYSVNITIMATLLILSFTIFIAESRIVGSSIFSEVIYEDENNVGARTVYEYHNTSDYSEYNGVPEDYISNFNSLRRIEEEGSLGDELIFEDLDDEGNGNENNNNLGFFIVGGNTVSPNRYMQHYQSICSTLRARTYHGRIYVSHSCGCTLIAPNVVLTAAHCGTFANYVQIGKLYQTPDLNARYGLNVETFYVSAVKYHKSWSRNTFNYDVMLLKLSGDSKKPVMKLQLSAIQRKTTDTLTIVGWGSTHASSKSSSNALREVNVQYLDTKKCKNEFYGSAIQDSMLCAYRKGKDACQGDSGGPLLRRDKKGEYIQIGIVSWGFLCAVYPGVYSDLSSTDSMTNFIHDGVCNSKTGFSPRSCKNNRLTNYV